MEDSKRPVGRPLFDGKDEGQIVAKLEYAWSLGCTDLEACLLADISKDTLYRYQREHPDFCERKERLKENMVLKARESVAKHLDESGELAIKYLERKKKDEFSLRSELTGADGGPVEVKEIKQLDDKALYAIAQRDNASGGDEGVGQTGVGSETSS